MLWQTTRFRIDLKQPQVMGIVNVTPDSFSDGGERLDPAQAHQAHPVHHDVDRVLARPRRLERDLQDSPRQALAAWRERIPAAADVEFYEQLLQKERREAQALGDRIARITSDLGAALASGPGTETGLQATLERCAQRGYAPHLPGGTA